MQIRKFLAAFFVAVFLMTENCSAGEDILPEMYANPKNYIYIGSGGTGIPLFISKSSLDVQEYAPPRYVIAIRCVIGSFQRKQENGVWRDDYHAHFGSTSRYLYDYNERKIYVEEKDTNNKLYWKYLDPQFANSIPSDPRMHDIVSAEFAFYFAYNQSFFDKPASISLKRYIETGAGTFDNR